MEEYMSDTSESEYTEEYDEYESEYEFENISDAKNTNTSNSKKNTVDKKYSV